MGKQWNQEPVIVVGFGRLGQLASPSPFVLKLQTWLRMVGIPYKDSAAYSPFEAPRGKAPYVKLPDGRIIGDSQLIINTLAPFGRELDAHLTDEGKARALAATRILEDHLYFIVVYERWVNEQGFQTLKQHYFEGKSWLSKLMIATMARSKIRKLTHLHGVARYTEEERKSQLKADLWALNYWLEQAPYLGGEEVCTADAGAYAFLAHLLYSPFAGYGQEEAEKCVAVVSYVKRMREEYWLEAENAQ